MPALATKVSVLSKEWTVWFLPEREFRKRYGANTLGVTEASDKEICLRAKKLTFETTAHELIHAYMDELCTVPADLTVEQQEEVFCDLIGRHGRQLIGQVSEILEAYLILKGKGR